MKYFTYKLWQALQGPDFTKAERKWQSRAAEYQKAFDRLRPHLGARTHRFFRTVGLHDAFVVGFEDRGAKSISLLVRQDEEVIQLDFEGVRLLQFDYRYSGASPAALLEWGYEEFSKIGPRMLQLEVLFSSGATLFVDFAKLRVALKGGVKAQ